MDWLGKDGIGQGKGWSLSGGVWPKYAGEEISPQCQQRQMRVGGYHGSQLAGRVQGLGH